MAAEGYRPQGGDFAGNAREKANVDGDVVLIFVRHLPWQSVRNGYLTNSGIIARYKKTSQIVNAPVIANSEEDWRTLIMYHHTLETPVILKYSSDYKIYIEKILSQKK